MVIARFDAIACLQSRHDHVASDRVSMCFRSELRLELLGLWGEQPLKTDDGHETGAR
jgi:hypothetical protein